MRTRKGLVVMLLTVLVVLAIAVGALFATGQADDVAEALGLDGVLGLDDDSDGDEATQPDEPAATVPGPMIEYADFDHIVTELRENDVECKDEEVRDDTGVSEFGVCFADGGSYQISIYVYRDGSDATSSVEELKEVWDQEIVVGPNWYVTTGNAELSEQVHEALGGEIHTP